jgi:hypothetical protein
VLLLSWLFKVSLIVSDVVAPLDKGQSVRDTSAVIAQNARGSTTKEPINAISKANVGILRQMNC